MRNVLQKGIFAMLVLELVLSPHLVHAAQANVNLGDQNPQSNMDGYVGSNALSNGGPSAQMKGVGKGPTSGHADLTPYLQQLQEMQMMAIQDKLLKMKMDHLKTEQEYKKAQSGARMSMGGDGGVPSNNALSAAGVPTSLMSELTDNIMQPQVITIIGVGKDRKAIVFIPGMGEMHVIKGQVMSNGWKVQEITSSSVLAVTRWGENKQLSYYSE